MLYPFRGTYSAVGNSGGGVKDRIIRWEKRFVSEDVNNDLEKGREHEVDEGDEMGRWHFEFLCGIANARNMRVEKVFDGSCDGDFFFAISFGSTTPS